MLSFLSSLLISISTFNQQNFFNRVTMIARVPIQQDRALLNAKFEGYKLSFLDESAQHFTPVGAPGPGVVVPKLPASAKLSYREVQSRIRHNHLHPGWNSLKPVNGDSSRNHAGVLFVIDDDFTLIALQFEKVRSMPCCIIDPIKKRVSRSALLTAVFFSV